MSLRIVEAQRHHLRAVAASMRPHDAAEIRQGLNQEPLEAMTAALDQSYLARTAFYDIEPLAMYGLSPFSVLGGSAQIWMFSTTGIDRHRFAFARASKGALAEIFAHCRLATNIVALDDALVVKWLGWLGAKFSPDEHERNGMRFGQFILPSRPLAERKQCQQG